MANDIEDLKQWGKNYAKGQPERDRKAKEILQEELVNYPNDEALKREYKFRFGKEPEGEIIGNIGKQDGEIIGNIKDISDGEIIGNIYKREYPKTDAFGSSLAETLLAPGLVGTKLMNKLGVITDERQKEIEQNWRDTFYNDSLNATRAEHPLMSAGGTLTGVVGQAVTGGLGGAALKEMAPKAFTTPGFVEGLSAVAAPAAGQFATTQQSNIAAGVPEDLATLDATQDAALQLASGPIPGGFGKNLAQRLYSGAGANIAQGMASRAIHNKITEDYPNVHRDVVDPLAMTLEGLMGGVAGSMSGKTPSTNKINYDFDYGKMLFTKELGTMYSSRDEMKVHLDNITKDNTQLSPELAQEKLFLENELHKVEAQIKQKERYLLGDVDYQRNIQISRGKILQDTQDIEDVNRFVGNEPQFEMAKPTPTLMDKLSTTNYNPKDPQHFKSIGELTGLLKALPNDFERRNWVDIQKETLGNAIANQEERIRGTQENIDLGNTAPFVQKSLDTAQRVLSMMQEKYDWLERQSFADSLAGKDLLTPDLNLIVNKFRADLENATPEQKFEITRTFIQRYSQYLADKRTHDGIVFDFENPMPHLSNLTGRLTNLLGLGKGQALTISNMRELPYEVKSLIRENGRFIGLHIEPKPGKSVVFIDDNYSLEQLSKYPTVRAAFDEMRLHSKKEFNLDSPTAREFLDTFILTHELGHHFLNRLFLSLQGKDENLKIWRNKTASLMAEYEKYIKKTNPKQYLDDTFMLPKMIDNFDPEKYFKSYSNFHEWFAQTFAQKILLGAETMPIKSAASSENMGFYKRAQLGLMSIFKSLASTLKRLDPILILKPHKLMEDFVNRYVAENESHLKAFGKHLIERRFEEQINNTTDWNKLNDFLRAVKKGSTDPLMFSMAKPPSHVDIETEVKEVSDAMMRVKDHNLTGLKILSNMFGDGQLKTIFNENPVLNYVYKVTKEAEWKATAAINKLWKGDISFDEFSQKRGVLPFLKRLVDPNSPEALLNRVSNSDLLTVWETFEKGFGQSYETTLKQHGATFTKEQREAFNILSKLFKDMYDTVTEHQYSLGKKHLLPFKEGWYPSIRKGEFFITMHDPQNGNVIYRQHFRTQEQAKLFLDRWNKVDAIHKAGITASDIQKLMMKKTEEEGNFGLVLASAIEEKLTEKFPLSSDVLKETVEDVINRFILRSGKLGKHHEKRFNVPGYLGSELFTTPVEKTKLIKEAIQSEAQEYISRMRKMEIYTRTAPLLDLENPELIKHAPSTMEAAKLMRDMATSSVPSSIDGIDNFLRHTMDRAVAKSAAYFGKDFYPKTPVWDRVSGGVGHLFYVIALTARPAFWVSQILTAPTSIRHIFREDDVFHGLASAGAGTLRVMHPDEDFLKAVYHVANNYNTFHPQFINDLTKLPLVKLNPDSLAEKVVNIATGERMATAADSFSRYWTFAMMYEHYKRKGLSGEKLYNAAADATDNTMIIYNRGHKAPMFIKGGTVGELASPLQTFAQAQIGNLVADFRLFLKNPSARAMMPMVATFLVTALSAGIIGVPLLAEYEAIRLLAINAFPEAEEYYPDPIGWILRGDNKLANHGTLGYFSGMDLGSGLRFNPIVAGIIDGRSGILDLLPTVKFAVDATSAVGTLGKKTLGGNVTDAELRKSAMTFTPGMYKGIVDDMFFDARTRSMVPDTKRSFGIVPQTPDERVASYLGTKTTKTARQNLINFREQAKDAVRTKQVTRTYDLLYEGLKKGDETQVDDAINRLEFLEVNPESIPRVLTSIDRNRNLTKEERAMLNKKLQIKTWENKRKTLNRLEYE